jgi:hypothetical protein
MHPFIYRELILAREADLRRRVELDRRVNAVISDRRRWRLSHVRWGGWRRPPRPAVERSTEMAKFMDVHRGFTGVTEDQLHAAHQRDLDVEAAEGVHFERAWLDPESGTVFCLSTGPSKEAVQRVHEKAGHPPDEVCEPCRSRPSRVRGTSRAYPARAARSWSRVGWATGGPLPYWLRACWAHATTCGSV